MRKPGVLLLVGAIAATGWPALLERPARAEEPPAEDAPVPLGRAGQLVLSIPRLLPLVEVNSWSVRSSSPTDATTGTWLSFGNHPGGLDVYDLPRLGLDAFAADRVTLGVDLAGYATLGKGPSLGSPYVSIFGAAPRIGYVAPVAGIASVWLRAGIAYYLLAEKGLDPAAAGATVPWSYAWHQLDADLEAYLVLAAFAHMAATVGVAVEAPLAGHFDEAKTGAPTVDASAGWLHVGVVGGILTYL
jgi:hypothetical protein